MYINHVTTRHTRVRATEPQSASTSSCCPAARLAQSGHVSTSEPVASVCGRFLALVRHGARARSVTTPRAAATPRIICLAAAPILVGRGRREQARHMWPRNSEPFCAGHLRARWGGARLSICSRHGYGVEGAGTPREHAGGANVRSVSCLPGRRNHRARHRPPQLLDLVVRSSTGRRSGAIEPIEDRSTTVREAVLSGFGSLVASFGACTHSEGGGQGCASRTRWRERGRDAPVAGTCRVRSDEAEAGTDARQTPVAARASARAAPREARGPFRPLCPCKGYHQTWREK